jgi:hypothetical protein
MASAHINITVEVPEDLRQALKEMAAATAQLAEIASLPRHIGARVRWATNGLIWTRTGENEWQPNEPAIGLEEARKDGWTAPSAHIASGEFEIIHD